MAIASFAPTASTTLAATTTSARVILPTTGTPTIALVTNLSGYPVFVQLGDVTVVASPGGSVAIMPGGQLALTIGANTYIAAVTLAGADGINVTVGN